MAVLCSLMQTSTFSTFLRKAGSHSTPRMWEERWRFVEGGWLVTDQMRLKEDIGFKIKACGTIYWCLRTRTTATLTFLHPYHKLEALETRFAKQWQVEVIQTDPGNRYHLYDMACSSSRRHLLVPLQENRAKKSHLVSYLPIFLILSLIQSWMFRCKTLLMDCMQVSW